MGSGYSILMGSRLNITRLHPYCRSQLSTVQPAIADLDCTHAPAFGEQFLRLHVD
jgi:hypothetical protein